MFLQLGTSYKRIYHDQNFSATEINQLLFIHNFKFYVQFVKLHCSIKRRILEVSLQRVCRTGRNFWNTYENMHTDIIFNYWPK